MKIHTFSTTMQGDLFTPVGLFYRLRDEYAEILLLESGDYHSKEDSLSFICCDAISSIQVTDDNVIHITHKNEYSESIVDNIVKQVEAYRSSFEFIQIDELSNRYNGIFGYTSYDAVRYFDKHVYELVKTRHDVPLLSYACYRYVVVFDHFYDLVHIIENCPQGEPSSLKHFQTMIHRQERDNMHFKVDGQETSNMSDQEFMTIVDECKHHCQIGNVFQVVPSRRFEVAYQGDDFNVYRKLRSVNPSPYLFYFDYGNFRIFGSSPEAQIKVNKGIAEIHPIAGTIKRTGVYGEDVEAAQSLINDAKENAEHIMLVDLARNDLSKNCEEIRVSKFKEVQFFSHVIHLVSVVKGAVKKGISSYQIFADTFPAGTLSGAPKHKAINLIDKSEPHKRGLYGGGIGVMAFNGDINHAIIIRSVFSKDKKLYLQAGAGVVIDSTSEGELSEVNRKVAAIKKAINEAQNIN